MPKTVSQIGNNVINSLAGLIPGSSVNVKKENEQRRLEQQKYQCEAKGGTWDSINNVCIMPQKAPKEVGPPKLINPDKPETFRDAETGKPSGVTLPDGRTFLGLNPEEIAQIGRAHEKKIAQPEGTQAFGTTAQQQKAAYAASQLGQVGPIGNLQEAPIDWGQALTAGTIGAAPGILASAASGAGGGFLAAGAAGAAGGPAAIPLAIAGGVVWAAVGILRGVQANIKAQQQGEIGAAMTVYDQGKEGLRKLGTLATRYPGNAIEFQEAYNQQLTEMYRAREQLYLETQGNLNKYMDDGRKNLAKFDTFLNEVEPYYRAQVALALQSGVPLEFTEEDMAEAEAVMA